MDRDKNSAYIIGFMAVITVISITLVSSVYLLTKETIRVNESAVKKQRLFSSAGIQIPETSRDIDRVYREAIVEKADSEGNILYYEIYSRESDSRVLQGYATFFRGRGLWGSIDAFISFGTDAETLLGIDFVSQNETPGLGARITEQWFRRQFEGKQIPLDFVPEGTDAGKGQFEAVTGATFTTGAVKNMINSASRELKEKLGKTRNNE